MNEESLQLERNAAGPEADILKITQKNRELDTKLERASKMMALSKMKAGRERTQAEPDIAVQLLCDFNESLNMLLMRSVKASPYTSDEILEQTQELAASFQLNAPVLSANTNASNARARRSRAPSVNSNASGRSLSSLTVVVVQNAYPLNSAKGFTQRSFYSTACDYISEI